MRPAGKVESVVLPNEQSAEFSEKCFGDNAGWLVGQYNQDRPYVRGGQTFEIVDDVRFERAIRRMGHEKRELAVQGGHFDRLDSRLGDALDDFRRTNRKTALGAP